MRILKYLKNHALKYKEIYINPLLSIAIIFLVIGLYYFLTSRKPITDVEGLVGATVNFFYLTLACIFIKFSKRHIFCDLTDEETKKLPRWRVILDSVETIILLFVSVYVITR